jgi:hypothetical protein
MPYCPNCNEEYEEGMSACINCGADLVDSPYADTEGEVLGNLDAVFIGPLAQAFELKSVLEDRGYTVYLQGEEDLSSGSRDYTDETGLVKLLVSLDVADTVSDLIDAMNAEDGKGSPADDFAFETSGTFDADLEGGFGLEEDFVPGEIEKEEAGLPSAGDAASPRTRPKPAKREGKTKKPLPKPARKPTVQRSKAAGKKTSPRSRKKTKSIKKKSTPKAPAKRKGKTPARKPSQSRPSRSRKSARKR